MRLSLLVRYLSLWILLAMTVGVGPVNVAFALGRRFYGLAMERT
jgi:hypothetical protein